MKTVKVKLSKDEIADRGLQLDAICNLLNKTSNSDWQEHSHDEIVEHESQDDGHVESIFWSVGEAKENSSGTYDFEMDC